MQTVIDAVKKIFFVVLAVVSLICAYYHANGNPLVDQQVLFFLIAAGVFLVFDRVNKISFGKDGGVIELEKQIAAVKQKIDDVGERVSEVQQVASENQAALTGGVGGVLKDDTRKTLLKGVALTASVDPEDPQRGRFGGEPARNHRILKADVKPASGAPGNYTIDLMVISDDARKPLTGTVTFYLHDTFNPDIRSVPVVDGKASLKLIAYGAFTVGAITDDGETLLELNLAENSEYPLEFTSR